MAFIVTRNVSPNATIPTFLLRGLNVNASAAPTVTADVTILCRADVGTIRCRSDVGTIHVRPDIGTVEA